MTPTKKEIDDFIVVAENENFSKAADFLNVKQAGLSKSIARLENELGQKLFIRGSRKLKLTRAGLIIYQQAKELHLFWSNSLQEIISLSEILSGHYSIGSHPVIARSVFPKLFKDIINFPGIKIQTSLLSSRDAVEEVRLLDLDFAIAVDPIPFPDLIIHPLWEEYIGAYSRDGLVKGKILYNPQMISAHQILSSFPEQEKVEVENYDIIHSILESSPEYMGFLPNPLITNSKKMKLIKKVSKKFKVCLVYRSDRMKTKAFKKIIELIRSYKL